MVLNHFSTFSACHYHLKSPAAYYLLLIYLFALCKPVMPLVQDIIAHAFFEHQHLNSVHKDDGKNHVSKEVGKLAQDENPTNSNSVKSYDDTPLHLVVSFELNLKTTQQILVHNSQPPDFFFPSVSIAIQLPPPRV